jgi:hypothetical protein
MNAHISIETALAIEEPYRFAVGQAVEHQVGGMRSVIADRQRTSLGTEIYEIHVIPEDAVGRPIRVIRGDALAERRQPTVSSKF